MRHLFTIFLILGVAWLNLTQAQLPPPTDCDIQVRTVASNASVNVRFELNWTYGCFGYMKPVYVQESIGNDQNFVTLDTIENNLYTDLPERQYGQTYYYRVYYPEEDRYSNITEKRVPNEYPVSIPFRNALRRNLPNAVTSNGELIITEAINTTGTLDLFNQNISDIRGIGYFINMDSIIVDENPIYHFHGISQYLYQDGTPPIVSVNNTFLTFLDFNSVDGLKVYNDFLFDNFQKIRVRLQVQNFEIRPGLHGGGTHQFMIAQPGDQVTVSLTQYIGGSGLFHDDNRYHWYKDGAFLSTTEDITFTLTSNATTTNAGAYYCEITNVNYPKVTLRSDVSVLSVANSPDDLPTTPVNDPIAKEYLRRHSHGAYFTSDGDLIQNAVKALKYIYLDRVEDSDSLKAQLKDLSFLEEAIYAEEIQISHSTAEIMPPLTGFSQLRIVELNDNKLTKIPALANNTALSIVDVSNNRLTFEDLYPLKDLDIRRLKLFPQKAFNDGGLMEASLGDPVTLDLAISDPLPGNVYEWYKDGVYVTSTNEGRLVIPSLSANNEGLYRCRIIHPEFPGNSILSGVYNVKDINGPGPGFYTLNDPVFADWLNTNFDGLIVNGNELNISRAAEITELHIDGITKITDLDGLQHFVYLKKFTSSHSSVQSVPDLSNLAINELFILQHANLSFTYLQSLEGLKSDSMLIENTDFIFQPLEPYENLRPSISGFDFGDKITLKNNSLKSMHEQSTFHWYKNDGLIQSGKPDSLMIEEFRRSDIATYSAKVTNPLFPGDTLRFWPRTIASSNKPSWWPAEFKIINPGLDSTFFMLFVENNHLQAGAIEPGDYMGVFFEDEQGALQVSSAGIWDGKFLRALSILQGDPDGIDPKIGFDKDEPFRYKLWDPLIEKEYNVMAEYVQPAEALPLLESTGWVIAEEFLDRITFHTDGLFHPTKGNDVADDEGKGWNWSLISNITGKQLSYYTLKDPAFANWLDSNINGLIVNGDQLDIAKATEITSMNIGTTSIKDLDGLQYFTQLREFTSKSNIQRVPDLSRLNALETFVATGANLSFNQLLGLENLVADSINISNGHFVFQPQEPYRTLFKSDGRFFDLGTDITLKNTSLKDIHEQSIWHWYKDDVIIQSGQEDGVSIPFHQRSDVGIYSARVTNPLFPGDTLHFASIFLAIDNIPSWWPHEVPVHGAGDAYGDALLTFSNNDLLIEGGIEHGDVVGVFYEDENGVMQAAKAGIWSGKELRGLFHLQIDVDGVDPKTGFEENEPLRYKLWDPVREKEYDVQAEYSDRWLANSIFQEPSGLNEEEGLSYTTEVHNDGLFHPSNAILDAENKVVGINFAFSIVTNLVGKNTPPWEVISGGPDNQLVIIPADVSADIQGQPLETGDYIGLFFEAEDGAWVCSDLAQWTGESLALNPWLSSGSIPKDGYALNETLKMKVWKQDSREEFIVDVIVYEDQVPFDATGLFNPNSMSKVNAIQADPPCTTQSIPLYPGWNLISSYIIPEETTMNDIFEGFNQIIVKDDLGSILYAPQNGITTGLWDHRQGYQVFVITQDTLHLCGSPVQDGSSIDVPLNTYPYFLPYWDAQPAPVNEIMASVEGKYDYLQRVKYDVRQRRFIADNYIPSHIIDPPIDQIGSMEPGLAYKVKMNGPARYAFPNVSVQNGRIADIFTRTHDHSFRYYGQSPQKSLDNTIIIVPADVLKKLEGIEYGDELAIKTPSGSVMGIGIFSGESMAITAWDVEGLKPGDLLQIEVWHSASNEVEKLKTSFTTDQGYQSGRLMKVSDLKNAPKGNPMLPATEFMAYPNPATTQLHVRIPFNNNETGVMNITDVTGRVIWNGDIKAVNDPIDIDVSDMEKGIYMLEINMSVNDTTWSVVKRIAIAD
ncbi:T9SS type A sorting domain-containing protein [Fulvivirga sp. M361]|uniref:T9SS type A sorting domain-containing protein n=1 Tax=Fulvivirga sp. M361 TaxID=2594266 RepID=UPI00117A19D9|nr:T9SS type A sorting domain-containing protein [Fulvivirga sp. M361]TRX57733.1 T9SS type A sorting domain-containing protein [Fulvivirga sp. M361]